MAAALAAEDPVFVLHTNRIDGVYIQEVRSASIRSEVAFGDFEADARRIGISPTRIVNRNDEAVDIRKRRSDGVGQVGGEGGDPALPRHVIAEHGDFADAGGSIEVVDKTS